MCGCVCRVFCRKVETLFNGCDFKEKYDCDGCCDGCCRSFNLRKPGLPRLEKLALRPRTHHGFAVACTVGECFLNDGEVKDELKVSDHVVGVEVKQVHGVEAFALLAVRLSFETADAPFPDSAALPWVKGGGHVIEVVSGEDVEPFLITGEFKRKEGAFA